MTNQADLHLWQSKQIAGEWVMLKFCRVQREWRATERSPSHNGVTRIELRLLADARRNPEAENRVRARGFGQRMWGTEAHSHEYMPAIAYKAHGQRIVLSKAIYPVGFNTISAAEGAAGRTIAAAHSAGVSPTGSTTTGRGNTSVVMCIVKLIGQQTLLSKALLRGKYFCEAAR